MGPPLYRSLSLSHSELEISTSCGDNVCAVLWQQRQQSVCEERKWCCIPPRSKVPGKNVYPVYGL